jgi:hypothetical protein
MELEMPRTDVKSEWEGGALTFKDAIGGSNVMTIARDGVYLNPVGYASTWYVDGNTNNTTLDGKTWATAFATLAAGLAAAHAFQTKAANRAWAKRSVVYVVGDALTETLTKLAEKTDVIGLGQCDGFFGARIIGNQLIGAPVYAGCRMFNLAFQADAGVIMTIPTTQSGIGFYGCDFLAGATTTIGLLATASTDLSVVNCNFRGSWNSNFSTAAIDLATGSANRTLIKGCHIENGGGIGIRVNAGRTGGGSFIEDNYISASTVTISDASSTFHVINNRLVSAANLGATSHVFVATKAVGNYITAADHVNNIIPAVT